MKVISKEQHVYSMNKENEPVLTCESGETVIFETCDCFSDLVNDAEYDWDQFLIRSNPATGPLFITGAEPGDSICLTIEKMELNSHGLLLTRPQMGLFGRELTDTLTTIVPIENNTVKLHGHTFPVKPMIGVIGVAPLAGDLACNTPNNHGGNLDCSVIGEGAMVLLPVFTEGALLSLGDLHALMGDGEVNGTGIECGGKVTVKVELKKGYRLNNPRVITNDRYYALASGIDLDMASGIASRELFHQLIEESGYAPCIAAQLLSAVGSLEICQVVNPLSTVRCSIPLPVYQGK